jgi:serine/threonine protein kinase
LLLTVARGVERRQTEVGAEATGLELAPVDLKEWVEKHRGYDDDTPEKRAELGKGGFAVTYRMAAPGGLLCAVKRFERRDMDKVGLTEDKVLKEAEMLGKLQHPHVVRYLGLLRTRRQLLLVMELAPGGSLADQVRRLPPPAQVQAWLRQLASALEYIHWRGCVHRDVKNANLLLVDGEDGGGVRLADFGLSFLLNSSLASQLVSRSGTSTYFAPERGRGREYGRKADLWAAGCCAVELLTGAPLTGPIWDEGVEVTRRREDLLRAAGERSAPAPAAPQPASPTHPPCLISFA